MSICTPNIPIPANPTAIEAQVGLIQGLLSGLSYENMSMVSIPWFANGDIFGLVETQGGIPKIHVGSGSYFDTLPKGGKAFCFFIEHDPREQLNESFVSTELSLIVWYDQRLYDRSPYRIKEAFIETIYNAFRSTQIDNIRVYKEEVFPRGINPPIDGFLDAPFDGFRIRFRLEYESGCPPNFVSSGANCF